MTKPKRPAVYICCAPDPVFALPDEVWVPFSAYLTGDPKHDYEAIMRLASEQDISPESIKERIVVELEEEIADAKRSDQFVLH